MCTSEPRSNLGTCFRTKKHALEPEICTSEPRSIPWNLKYVLQNLKHTSKPVIYTSEP